MSAGQVPSPMIMAMDQSAVVNQKKATVRSDCIFQIEPHDSKHKIYFTVNKSRPEPWDLPKKLRLMTINQRETLLYKNPFWMLPGKRTIKAMSVREDGRESNVVTRVFLINDEEEDCIIDSQYKCADTLVQNQLNVNKKNLSSIEFSSQRWDDGVQSIFYEEEIVTKVDLCHYCDCEYALGPDVARFCSQCSKPVPKYSECEPGKVYNGCTGVCKSCSSFIPLDGTNCPVCDAPIAQREIDVVNFDFEGQKICGSCSRTSPPDAAACQFCEKPFPLPVMIGQAVPPKLNPGGAAQSCSTCDRRCSPEARICDWCGVPLPTATGQDCAICNTKLPPWVSYCGVCGIYFDPPPRLDPRNSTLGPVSTNLPFDQLPQWSDQPLPQFEWPETPRPGKDTPMPVIAHFVERSCQAPPLLKSKKKPLMGNIPKKTMTVVSAGQGFWRKQLAHITDHNNSIAEKDQVYRQKVADLKLGQLIATELQFHQDSETMDQSMIIVLSFARVDHPDYPSSMDQSVRELYSQIAPKTTKGKPDKPKQNTKSQKMQRNKALKEKNADSLSHDERMLMAEVGPRGQHRLAQIAQLIESGANINCQNDKGFSPLYFGVSSRNIESVRALVSSGARLNNKYDRSDDTVLHMAVIKKNIDIIQALLDANASIKVRNKKGETPYDLAMVSDSAKIMTIFNQHQGKLLLKKHIGTESILKTSHGVL